MGLSHYSAARAKESLVHFIFGKAASACLSAAFLALTVRHMTASDYGTYIVFLAILDVFYLTTGFGLSTVAQRYVAEYRTNASTRCLQTFLGKLFIRRLSHSLFFAALLLLAHQWAAPFVGLTLAGNLVYWAALLLVTSASSFFFDEVLGSLLMQGLFQGISVGKIFLKLVGAAFLVYSCGGISIESLLVVECAVSLVILCAGHFLLATQLRASHSEENACDNYDNAALWITARKFYLVQLLGQVYGPNITRMLISRLLGLAQTAVFGFAQSVADMLRNCMPAHLLAGWLRPLMISRYLARRNLDDLADVANLVLKLNLLGIVPLAFFFLLRGDAFGTWVSGGRYPHAGSLITLLTIMIGLQTAHLLFAMITMTIEKPNANICATLLAALSMPISLMLISLYGVQGAAWGLLASELVWLITATLLLARHKFFLTWDFLGGSRIVLAGAASGFLLWVLGFERAQLSDIVISSAVLALAFLVCSVFAKPLREQERALLRGIIPARLIIW